MYERIWCMEQIDALVEVDPEVNLLEVDTAVSVRRRAVFAELAVWTRPSYLTRVYMQYFMEPDALDFFVRPQYV